MLGYISSTDVEEKAKHCSEDVDLINTKPQYSCVRDRLAHPARCEKCICPLSNEYKWMIDC